MTISGAYSEWILVAIVVVGVVVMSFATEGLLLTTGALLVRVLSVGKVKIGDMRNIGKAPPKSTGGEVFYYEGDVCFIYANYVRAIGFFFWILLFVAIGAWRVS